MKISRFSTILISLAAFTAIAALVLIDRKYGAKVVSIPKFDHQAHTPANTPPDSNQIAPAENLQSKISNLKSVLLPVPFTPQAPTGNWDQLHNEACEEASALMANAYFNGCIDCHATQDQKSKGSTSLSAFRGHLPSPVLDSEARTRRGEKDPETQLDTPNLSADYVEKEINKLTKWQDENLGFHLDSTSAETARMTEEVYSLKTKLIENFSENDLKTELAQNHLVLISENGRNLGNPYYKRPGPIHHMLVIKGYDEKNFTTNDSGTKRGLNYSYDFNTIYDAAADWDHSINTVDNNKKIAIIVWKE